MLRQVSWRKKFQDSWRDISISHCTNTHAASSMGFSWCRALCIWRPGGLRSVEATPLSTQHWHCLSGRYDIFLFMYRFLTKLLCNNRTNSDQGISNAVRRRQNSGVMFCCGVCLEGESKVVPVLNNALLLSRQANGQFEVQLHAFLTSVVGAD